MEFDFNQQLAPLNSIDIPEIGNFALEAVNDDGFYYYLIIRTFFGTCVQITWGPVVPDIAMTLNNFNLSVNKYNFKEPKIISNINYFLNDAKRKITGAKVLDIDQALDQLSVESYLRNLNEESF